ncbi:uncharacterized protein V1518DRAFT_409664 [Limtongia smithiae]|uniref:uncharacterized protein n=1 Tax=Limtongia smithiae TaxID=1125753 RepID=UPI0034CD96E6
MDPTSRLVFSAMQSVFQFGDSQPRARRPKKQFICRFCHMNFKRSEHLTRHERSHTAEKPFECSFCQTPFSRKDLLLRHSRKCIAAIEYQNLNPNPGSTAESPISADSNARRIKKLKTATARKNSDGLDFNKLFKSRTTSSGITDTTYEHADHADMPEAFVPKFDDQAQCDSTSSFSRLILDDMASSTPALSDASYTETDTTSSIQNLVLQDYEDTVFGTGFAPIDLQSYSSIDEWDPLSPPALFSGKRAPDAASYSVSDHLTENFDLDMNNLSASVIMYDESVKNLQTILRGITGAEVVLPDAERLSMYVVSYKIRFDQQLPFIHSTFWRLSFLHGSIDEYNISAELQVCAQLLLAVASIGAAYMSDMEDGKKLCNLCENHLETLLREKFIFSSDQYLPLLQAKLLTCIFNAWSGEARLVERMFNSLPFLSRCCSYCLPCRTKHDLGSWSKWITRESYHRLFWGIFIFMSNLNLVYGQSISIGLINELPLPGSDILWSAPTSEEFDSLQPSLKTSTSPTDTIAKLISDSPMDLSSIDYTENRISNFAIIVLLHVVIQNFGDTHQAPLFGALILSDHIEKFVKYLTNCLLKSPNTTSRTVVESLSHIIKLRQIEVSTTPHFRCLLSDPNFTESCDTVARAFAEGSSCTQGCGSDKAIYLSLPYIRRFLQTNGEFESIEQLFCYWESMLSLITWLHGVELAALGSRSMSVEEQFVVDSLELFADARASSYGAFSLTSRILQISEERFMASESMGVSKAMAEIMRTLGRYM